MNIFTKMKTKLILIVVVAVLFGVVLSGCAVHGEVSMGAGTGSKYAAAMSGRRGAGIDFPADSTSIETESKTSVSRPARD